MPTPAAAANAYVALAQLRDQSSGLGHDASAQGDGLNFGSVLKDVMASVKSALKLGPPASAPSAESGLAPRANAEAASVIRASAA